MKPLALLAAGFWIFAAGSLVSAAALKAGDKAPDFTAPLSDGTKHGLPFPLASDSDKKIAKAFGVDGLLFAKRATFIIGKDRTILWAAPSVDTASHGRELEEALSKLAPRSRRELS